MSWFKKEKIPQKNGPNNVSNLLELPELPPLKTKFSDFPQRGEQSELPPLPSFPSSSTGDMISRQMVKQAFSGSEQKSQEEEDGFYAPQRKPLTIEADESYPTPRFQQFRKFEKSTFEQNFKKEPRSPKGPVYIRIDKYQEALLNFQKIKTKIIEIENLLKELKEIKTKEEFDLKSWEREIQDAKNKLSQIDSSLFQKLGE